MALPQSRPLLTADEEAELARKIEAGVAAAAVLAGQPLRVDASREELQRIATEGEQAREHFLLSHLRLVAFAMSGAGRDIGVSRDEVFQEGVAAMAEALGKYDWQRGRFSTHAYPAIKWRTHEHVRSGGGSLGVPAHQAIQIRRARAIAARLESESGRPAQLSDVAAELGRSQAATESLLRHHAPRSIEAMAEEVQERLLVAPPAIDPVDDIRVDLRRLPADQRDAITLRYGLADGQARSFREVAQETGWSAATVRRSCKLGLATLRSGPAEPADETPATMARVRATAESLKEVDRLSKAGLSLVEVAIALKTEPVVVHDLCQAGQRQDLLARFGRLEQTYGFEPGPYTAPYVVITEESTRRRDRFQAAQKDTPPGQQLAQRAEQIRASRSAALEQPARPAQAVREPPSARR